MALEAKAWKRHPGGSLDMRVTSQQVMMPCAETGPPAEESEPDCLSIAFTEEQKGGQPGNRGNNTRDGLFMKLSQHFRRIFFFFWTHTKNHNINMRARQNVCGKIKLIGKFISAQTFHRIHALSYAHVSHENRSYLLSDVCLLVSELRRVPCHPTGTGWFVIV